MNIAQRLREGIDPNDIPEAERAMDAGADEIERLRAEREDYKDVANDLQYLCKTKDAEIERLGAVLHDVIALDHHNHGPESTAAKLARAVLRHE